MSETSISKEAAAEDIIRTYTLWSFGAGAIPIPVGDIAAIAAVNLKMLADLSVLYQVPFSENQGTSILSSVVGAVTARSVTANLIGTLLKFIPGVGMLLGLFTRPLAASATTYAVGKVFIQHFETGGTLLEFNTAEVEEILAEQYPETEVDAAPASEEPVPSPAGTSLTTLEGIGEVYAAKLNTAGVGSVEKLLEAGATPEGRQDLIEQTGIDGKRLLRFLNYADLIRIDGVSGEYAELLVAARVKTVVALSRRKAENLHGKLVQVNKEKKLVRKVPSAGQVADWCEQAKSLERAITY